MNDEDTCKRCGIHGGYHTPRCEIQQELDEQSARIAALEAENAELRAALHEIELNTEQECVTLQQANWNLEQVNKKVNAAALTVWRAKRNA